MVSKFDDKPAQKSSISSTKASYARGLLIKKGILQRIRYMSLSFVRKLLDACFVRSWWVFLFVVLCYGLYSQGMHKKKAAQRELLTRLEEYQAQKIQALEEQEDFLLQIQSQTDPAWIEMILMKKLGVVPEGQTKVYFEK